MNPVYTINKGVNRPMVFRGLRAQYIWWLAIGLVVVLLAFSVLYVTGVPMPVCCLLVGISATLYVARVYRMNRVFGEHGRMKAQARRATPLCISCDKLFHR